MAATVRSFSTYSWAIDDLTSDCRAQAAARRLTCEPRANVPEYLITIFFVVQRLCLKLSASKLIRTDQINRYSNRAIEGVPFMKPWIVGTATIALSLGLLASAPAGAVTLALANALLAGGASLQGGRKSSSTPNIT